MRKLFASFAFVALTAPLWGQLADMIQLPDAEPAPQTAPAQASPAFSEEQMLQTWGWLLADRFNLGGFNFTDAEMDQIHEGMVAYVRNQPPATNPNESMQSMQQYFVDREQRAIAENKRKREEDKRLNKEKEADFFDTLFGNPDVKSLGSGLYYQIQKPGGERHPKPSDTVIVNYEGRFLDNSIFDTTNGRQPAQFKLNEVIDGWTQGVPLIGEGGKIKLFVPYRLAYGEDGTDSIPPAATLVFEVELLKIVDQAAAPASAPAPAPAAPETPVAE